MLSKKECFSQKSAIFKLREHFYSSKARKVRVIALCSLPVFTQALAQPGTVGKSMFLVNWELLFCLMEIEETI